jgi:DNA-binding transcriptional ArsR family regulator
MASILKNLRLLADPSRLRILLLVEREELSVAELQEILGMGQSRISTHLAQLKNAGLVEDRRNGKSILYRLKHGAQSNGFSQMLGVLRQAAAEIPEAEQDSEALRLALRRGRTRCAPISTSWRASSGATTFQAGPGKARRNAAHVDAAHGDRRLGRRRRHVLAIAGPALEESDCRRQLGKDGGVRPRAGAQARRQESRIPQGRSRRSADPRCPWISRSSARRCITRSIPSVRWPRRGAS